MQSVPIVSFLLSVVQYNWFQVSDGQGKTDSKSTKITVLPDPDYLNVVEVVLNKNISHFFQKQVSCPPPLSIDRQKAKAYEFYEASKTSLLPSFFCKMISTLSQL